MNDYLFSVSSVKEKTRCCAWQRANCKIRLFLDLVWLHFVHLPSGHFLHKIKEKCTLILGVFAKYNRGIAPWEFSMDEHMLS